MSIDMLTPNPANERDETQDGADELVDAIREQGVLQPLGIAPVSAAAEEWPEHADELTASGATWCVILGNRRLWAAAKAGLETVPVYKISGDLRVAMLSENVNRQDMRPLAEADVLLELVNRLGGQQQAASALGRSQGWVSQRLALRRLAPELQAAIEAGELTARDARSYTSLSHDEQRAAYYRVITGHGAGGSTDDGAGLLPGNTDAQSMSKKSKRSKPVRLHPGLPKAASAARVAAREFVLALNDARQGGDDDGLRGAVEELAAGFGCSVDELPPSVLRAAGYDR